jgi:hypothetical protein
MTNADCPISPGRILGLREIANALGDGISPEKVLVLYLDRPGSKPVAAQLCAGDSDTAT